MIGNLKADDQQAVLRKNHNFKELIDKWCISNASLDNALLVSKFIEIIMLIK